MNFFEEQERAAKESRRLVKLFALVVIMTAILAGLMFAAFLWSYDAVESLSQIAPFCMAVSALTGLVILIVSLLRIRKLKKNTSSYLAESLGGVRVNFSDKDQLLSRYVNVAQEMSLAAGIPVPNLYYLPSEMGINGFASGDSINDATILVTQGALVQLNRDELQALVAHEFGHIISGDMVINLRLLGFLAGLTYLYESGAYLAGWQREGSSRSSKETVGLGLGLMIVGGLGMLAGAFLKSCLSTTREFAADATCVKLTRNLDGIGGLLKKLLVRPSNSWVKSKGSAEASYMFIAETVAIKGLRFDTHPPLEERLQKIYKNFSRKDFFRNEMGKLATLMRKQRAEYEATLHQPLKENSSLPTSSFYSIALFRKLSCPGSSGTSVPFGFLPLFAIVLQRCQIHQDCVMQIKESLSKTEAQKVIELAHDFELQADLPVKNIIELAIGYLRGSDRSELLKGLKIFNSLAKADNKINFYEALIQFFLRVNLDLDLKNLKGGRHTRSTFSKELSYLLSFAHYYQGKSEEKFFKIMAKSTHLIIPFIPLSEFSFTRLQRALVYLGKAKAYEKQQAMKLLRSLFKEGKLSSQDRDFIYLAGECIGIPGQA